MDGSGRLRCFNRWNVLGVVAGFVLALVAGEASIRRWPRLLPNTYLQSLPHRGMALFHPGLLESTPIGGFPVPSPHEVGREYQIICDRTRPDLVKAGLVSEDDYPEVARAHDCVLFVDALGLPNRGVPRRADIVIVGNSFALWASAETPRGIHRRLAAELDREVYSIALPGIGTERQVWMAERVAVPLRARVVVLFCMVKRDFEEAAAIESRRRDGVNRFADLWPEGTKPPWILADLMRFRARAKEFDRPPGRPLPPFVVSATRRPTWFAPRFLLEQLVPAAQWHRDPRAVSGRAALVRLRDAIQAAGGTLLVVHVPDKGEVLLPHVKPDPDLAARYLERAVGGPLPIPSEELWRLLLDNRRGAGLFLGEVCRKEGIEFLDLHPALDAAARRGREVFIPADTHWGPDAFEVIRRPLGRRIARLLP